MFFRILLPAALVAVGVQIAGSTVAESAAEATSKAPLQVQVSLVSNSTFSLGEPIVLKYKIVNASPERVGTYVAPEDASWFSRSLTNLGCHTVTVKDEQPDYQKKGSHIVSLGVPAYSSTTGYVVTDTRANVLTPGRYFLTVRTRLPYALGAQAEEMSPKTYETSDNVVTTDFKILLNVTPYDPHKL